MDAYLAKNNSEEGKKYSLLLTELKDSIKTAEKHSVNKVTNAIKKGKDIEKNNILKTYLYIFLAAIIIGCGGVWYYWKKRNKLLQQRFHELIEKIKNESEDKNAGKEKDKQKVIGAPIAMSEETINQLLDKISKFERSEKYLKTDLTLAKLAVSFNTNTKYLSEVIKYHKNKNFNNYINSLRIGYITRKLYEDSRYRRYKISSLAEICGYSSFRAFQTVFKKETGLTPSDFIENLKKKWKCSNDL